MADDELADQLPGKAQAEGVELLGPDGLCQVTKVGARALAEETTARVACETRYPVGAGALSP